MTIQILTRFGGLVGTKLSNHLLKPPLGRKAKLSLVRWVIDDLFEIATSSQSVRTAAVLARYGPTSARPLKASINSDRYRFQSNTTANPAGKRIDDLIKNSKRNVFLFMKGVPEQPACGYSNAVVQILKAYEVEFDSFNVLDDDDIRQEIKVYSNWPTIPQLYVNKDFVGGCDILIQMHQSGELEKLFKDSQVGQES